MCVKAFISTMLLGMMMVCGLDLLGSTNSAEARDYYTRKRVNGVWITGHFQRKRALPTDKLQANASVAPGPVPQPSTPSSLARGEDRSPPFQHAVEAPSPGIADEFAVSPPQEPRLLPLQRALEARAKVIATSENNGAMRGRAVRSMTLDFESRTKIILFVDGSRAEEPFDPASPGALNTTAMH